MMLTRLQLADIARREGVPLGAIERDYLQHLILRHAAHEPFAFKGGTCLRITLGSPRYSEDLDFNAACGAEEAMELLSTASARLMDYGIRAETVRRRPEAGNLQASILFEGPLFVGTSQSRGSVRIELSLRQERVDLEEAFVPRTPYADVPQLVLRVLTKEHLLAEKARALIIRQKPRDLYDLHFLLSREVVCSRALLDEKLQLYRRKFALTALEEGIRQAGRSWERDLKPLLGQLPPYRAVAESVRSAFRSMLRSEG